MNMNNLRMGMNPLFQGGMNMAEMAQNFQMGMGMHTNFVFKYM